MLRLSKLSSAAPDFSLVSMPQTHDLAIFRPVRLQTVAIAGPCVQNVKLGLCLYENLASAIRPELDIILEKTKTK